MDIMREIETKCGNGWTQENLLNINYIAGIIRADERERIKELTNFPTIRSGGLISMNEGYWDRLCGALKLERIQLIESSH